MKRVAAGLGLIAFLMVLAGGSLAAQVGERPQDTDYTDDAEDAIDDAEDEDDEAKRRQYYVIALTAAQAEIAENPNNPLGHRLAALASLELEQYAEAGAHFDRAQEIYPLYEFEDSGLREQTWIDLYQEASPLISGGDYEGATAIFENAHAIFQDRPEIMVTLAQLYGSLGEYERSIAFIEQVDVFMNSEAVATKDSATIAEWQDQASVLPLLHAQTLAGSGRSAEAADAYRSLSEADPTNMDHVRSLATVLMDSGDEAAALVVYADLLSKPGLTGPDLFSIGVGFYQANDWVNAVRAFSQAVELNATDRDSAEMWARTLLLDKLFVEIPAVAEQWASLDPNSQNAYLIWAQAANTNGDAETTQRTMGIAQDMEVTVDQLQLQRFGAGGGNVSGNVMNKTLEEGTSVTLTVTFYGASGSPIGTVTSSVTLAAADMAELFNAQFDSAELIGGYSYELTVG
ncbi:MAG: tetratricopeptide repeat protein [Longimicrobiales bacterium]